MPNYPKIEMATVPLLPKGFFWGLGQPDRRLNFITDFIISLLEKRLSPSHYPLPVLPKII
jgi:hypothetical protein